MIIIRLKDFVENSSSNTEGIKLFHAFKDAFNNTKQVLLSVDNDIPMSSSFLNSSVGMFIEDFGIQNFKNTVKFKGSKSQFERLSNYISRYVNTI